MKVLHITPHMGGGVGTVITGWMEKIGGKDHHIMCLDTINDKSRDALEKVRMGLFNWHQIHTLNTVKQFIEEADIVLVHYWDHPMLAKLFSEPIPDCRLVFWCHKNYPVPNKEVKYPDKFINTSPIQDRGIWHGEPMEYIWSTGNMDRFLAIEPVLHKGFNIGMLSSPKMYQEWYRIVDSINNIIPDACFTMLGEIAPSSKFPGYVNYVGKVDDVAPYLAEMDVFAYPLRPDHYGTCEIALGEAMAAGVVPVVMDNPAENVIVKNNENGVVAHSEKDFIYTVKYLYKVVECRRRLANVAKNDAAYLYSIDNMIASWDNTFNEMMQSPKTKKGALL